MADKNQPKYKSPYQYAKACGVSTTAINNRIKNGLLEVEEITDPIDGTLRRYINLEKYPVEKTIAEMRSYPIESKQWKKKKE